MSNTVQIKQSEIISDQQYTLKEVIFDYHKKDGEWQTKKHEVYDMGNAATALLYNKEQKTVILTKQFRLPTYLNGNNSGMLIETCAGKLDEDSPEECIKREIREETGYEINKVEKVMEVYSTPGTVTEMLHLFIAEYTKEMKKGEGGGLKSEQEEVQVLEIPFHKAVESLNKGDIKDAKTVILLQYALLHQLL